MKLELGATYFELPDTSLISFTGEDAASFLHGQLTSDISALPRSRTQYSGYCSPKGRLIATLLVWRREADCLLQLPLALHQEVQARLSKYILRSRVKVADAGPAFHLLGVAGDAAAECIARLGLSVPAETHSVVSSDLADVTRLPLDRYLILAPAAHAADMRARLAREAARSEPDAWHGLDVAAGVAVITAQTSEKYVPQMVNLDLIGGVSYSKGCYPGQEIVARTHYLGRQKQRTYRIRVNGAVTMQIGDPLFSAAFGAQSSGAIVYLGANEVGSREALAVIQQLGIEAGPIHLHAADGPVVEFLSLPYSLPA